MKIQSDLVGNHERLAEMTSPAATGRNTSLNADATVVNGDTLTVTETVTLSG